MSYYCEVCNGMNTITTQCPRCHHSAMDCGRYNDFMGPYTPYRGIDDVSVTNSYSEFMQHLCVHIMNCEYCGHTFHFTIQESQT